MLVHEIVNQRQEPQHQQQSEFRVALDKMGTAAVFHPLIKRPLRIAHLTDLHILPEQFEGYSDDFARFVRWQSEELSNPNAGAAQACAVLAAAQPDVVLVGGDIVDFLDDQAIDIAMNLISRAAPRVLCCVGNHERPWSLRVPIDMPIHFEIDSADDRARRVAHRDSARIELSRQPLEEVASRFGLNVNSHTGRIDYAVNHDGIKILVLDSSFGELTPEQAQWTGAQVEDGLPFLILTHVPFPVLTLIPRIRILAGNMMLGHILDNEACHTVMNVTKRANFVGVLAGHIHVRSEDVIGNGVQFLTQPAAFGGYRIIDLMPVRSPRVFSPTSLRLTRRPHSTPAIALG